MEDYAKEFVKSIEEDVYKDRLDKVLSKFEKYMFGGKWRNFTKDVIDIDYCVETNEFSMGDITISLATVESLLKDMEANNDV